MAMSTGKKWGIGGLVLLFLALGAAALYEFTDLFKKKEPVKKAKTKEEIANQVEPVITQHNQPTE